MGKREKKIAVIQEYLPRCNSVYPCYVYGRIPSELINNACMTYAGNVRKEDVFGLIDETVFSSGKKGFLFAEDGFYHSDDNSASMTWKASYPYQSSVLRITAAHRRPFSPMLSHSH